MENPILSRMTIVALALTTLTLGGRADAQWQKSDHPFASLCNVVVMSTAVEDGSQTSRLQLECSFREIGAATGVGTRRLSPAGSADEAFLPMVMTEEVSYQMHSGHTLRTLFLGGGRLDRGTGTLTYAGAMSVVGGTGRYRNASGTQIVTGELSLATGRAFFTSSGVLSYWVKLDGEQ